jgi:lysozyme
LVDVDTLKNIPFTLFSFAVGNDRLINNLRKLAWCQKHQPYPGVSLLSSQRKFTRTGDSFIKTVSLKSGDLPPVDIERLPEYQSVDRLKIGLKDG